jgi:hypothetical protein
LGLIPPVPAIPGSLASLNRIITSGLSSQSSGKYSLQAHILFSLLIHNAHTSIITIRPVIVFWKTCTSASTG